MNVAPARLLRVPLALALLAAAGALIAAGTTGVASAGPVAGGEFLVNTGVANTQSHSSIDMDADGDYVVVWQSNLWDGSSYGVYAQRYDAAGSPQGPETRVNTTTANSQQDPSVAMDADGDYVVAWESNLQDGDLNGIYIQRYDAAGNRQGSETRVNTFVTDQQQDPSVAMDADGDFVVTWASGGQDTELGGIYAQRYDAAGVAQGPETPVNTTIANNQFAPSVAMDADGDYVVAWTSVGQDGSGIGVYAKRYDAAGVVQGAETRVNTTTTQDQDEPSVAMSADGDYVVAWTSRSQDGNVDGVYAQRYDAGGTPRGTETLVNTTTANNQNAPNVVMDADGDYVVAWTSLGQDGGAEGVYAQRYDISGAPQGSETQVNVSTARSQLAPSAAMDADGDFTVTWSSWEHDGSLYGVYGRRFRGPEAIDLALTQADNLDPVAVNGRVSYRVRVRNLNDPVEDTGVATIDAAIGAATGVYVMSAIPDDATFYSASGTGWNCTAFPATVRCRLAAPLRPSEVSPGLTLTYQMSNAAGAALHPAQVYENQLDPVSGNNSEVERTSVLCSVSFASPSFSAPEAGSLVVGVNRTGTNCGSASVQYETASGTATDSADFVDVSDTLTFEEGDAAASFPVPIVADSLDESAERFKLRLLNPAGALLGRPALVNATINDNDLPPRINFTSSGATGSEPGALVEVTLRLSEVSGQPVTVTISKTGTATSGADYFAPATATIPAGQRTVSFDVEIADDPSVEASEAANLILSSPVNATLGSLRTFRLLINDDD